MKTVLVTGANGFLGKYIMRLLVEKDYEVHGITREVKLFDETKCTWHKLNLLDTSGIKKVMKEIRPSHLLHFAWVTNPETYRVSKENFLWVQSSLELIRQFRDQGGVRAVLAGTCFEYDWNYGYCSEAITPACPTTFYGQCKQSLNEMLRIYSKNTGLSSAWGRIFFTYGPGEDSRKLVSSVISALLRGEPARCSHGNQIRDYLFVEDIAELFIALLESEVEGVVNIGSGNPVRLKEIVIKIGELLGREELIRFGEIPVAEGEPGVILADIGRAVHEVGWRPKYDLQYGLEKTIYWWKGQLGLKDR